MDKAREKLIKEVWDRWKYSPSLRSYAHLQSIKLPIAKLYDVVPRYVDDGKTIPEVALRFERRLVYHPDARIEEVVCEGVVVETYFN